MIVKYNIIVNNDLFACKINNIIIMTHTVALSKNRILQALCMSAYGVGFEVNSVDAVVCIEFYYVGGGGESTICNAVASTTVDGAVVIKHNNIRFGGGV